MPTTDKIKTSAVSELEEDQMWEMLAERRDAEGARYLSHDEVWK